VPRRTDAGLLYYRTENATAPRTWQEVYATALSRDGIVYQGAAYESLSIHFLEMAYSAGGAVLSPDGTKSVIDSPANLQVLELMRAGIARGAAPRAVVRMNEETARRVFAAGRATFMRSWPYAYVLLNWKRESDVVGRFQAAPLPAFGAHERSGVLAGFDVGVAARTEHKDAALMFVDFLTGPKEAERAMVDFTVAPALKATYRSPDIGSALPYTRSSRASSRSRSRVRSHPRGSRSRSRCPSTSTPCWRAGSRRVPRSAPPIATSHASSPTHRSRPETNVAGTASFWRVRLRNQG
jgi:ABC-type glycerol-3-phosphate transport system substrate-binding protein